MAAGMDKRRDSLLHLDLDVAEARRVLGDLARRLADPRKLRRIIARAQNDALLTSKAEAKRAIREEYNAPAADIEKTMRLKRSHPDILQATLIMKGRMSVELIRYGAKDPNAARRRKGSGVTVKVLKSSRRGAIRPGGKHHIMATAARGVSATWIAKGHVLARVEDAATPIKILYGPSFLSRMSHEDVRMRLTRKAGARFADRLQFYAGQAV